MGARQGRGGAGRHNQALSVAAPTAEEKREEKVEVGERLHISKKKKK